MAFRLTGPGSIDIAPGQSAWATINVMKYRGKAQRVNLSVRLESQLSQVLSTSTGMPSYQSVVTVTADSTLPDGDYPITVTATDGREVKTLLIVARNRVQPTPPVAGPAAPVLSTLSPSSITEDTGAFTLTVNGSGFVSGAVVLWNGSSRSTTFVNSGQVTAAILAGDITTPGTASVTATNPSSAASNALTFTINSAGGFDPVKAFPSAEGFGADTNTHARNASATVYHVTTLSDTGTAGSLRYALTQSGPRYIVFDVSGDIDLGTTDPVQINNGNLYIAGQTSPNGIQIKGYDSNLLFRGGCHDIVVRHLRVRPGGGTESNGQNLIFYGGDGTVSDIIVDHCSIEWGGDSMLQFYQPHNNCVLQWSIIADGSGGGSAIHCGKSNTCNDSFHHNLIANCADRMPLIQQSGITDFRCNIIYNNTAAKSLFGQVNTGNSTYEAAKVNLVKNLWRSGPNTDTGAGVIWLENGASCPCGTVDRGGTKLYLSGNEKPSGAFTWTDGVIWNGDPYRCSGASETLATNAEFGSTEFTAAAITENAANTLVSVILPTVGACRIQNAGVQGGTVSAGLVRDSADTTIVNHCSAQTGSLLGGSSGTYPTLTGGASAPTDTDGDGVPDWYCTLHGQSTTGNIALTFHANGYQWIENYLNELAGDTVQYTP